MPKKKSLADELAELINPAPTKEFDPEADVFGAGPALVESDDELAGQLPTRRKGKEAGRMRGDIVMEGREYAGRRSSRAAIFGGEEEEEQEEGEEEGGSGSGSDEDQLAGGSNGEEEGRQANGRLGRGGSSGSESESGSDSDGEGEGLEDDWLNGDDAGGSSDEEPEQAAAGTGGSARRKAAAKAARAAAGGSDSEGSGGAGTSGDGESEGDDDEEEGGAAARGGGAAAVAAAAADEMADLEREYEQMQQEEQSALAGLKERAAKERKKALAVQAQKTVWQRGLEQRILLQRALAGANRLPQGEMQATAVASSAELAAAFSGLAADAAAVLGQLLELAGALTEQNPAVAEAAAAVAAAGEEQGGPAAVGSKRRRGEGEQQQQAAAGGQEQRSEALWQQLDAAYAGFAPFRDASIDRWHRKTVLTTGGASLRGQLKVLNQSVSTQVAQLMQDPGRVLHRTRLLRATQQQPQHRLLGCDPEQRPNKRQRQGGDEEAAAEDPVVDGAANDDGEEERDPETFDDTEFYQTLLREFLEGSADAGGANWHTGPKQRKQVDRRASKGRKLRYHVHEKLVNFMTPVELEAPQFAAQLFTNLFGGSSGGGGGGGGK